MVDVELAARFGNLFRGNTRSYGEYIEGKKSPARTVKSKKYDIKNFQDHLDGKVGLGIVPIRDDTTCWFAALDLDAHDDLPDIDLVALEERVREKDLPLTVCRSKSGGAHLYLFGSEPLPAKVVRSTMSRWSEELGHSGCEIFPKQEHLPDIPGEGRQWGNWINLCYFDADNAEQKRYSFEGGRRIEFEHFLDTAENRRVSAAALLERSETSHAEAPPCIQSMIVSGVPSGYRNEALYNYSVYLKKAFPETWRDKAFDLNARTFDKPLTHSEAKKTITSAGRREYRYKCKEEPCRSLCKSSICVTRKYGITPEEKGELEMGSYPEFGPLKKYMTDPVRWGIAVDGKEIVLSTIEIMDYRKVRESVADSLTKLIPPMKNDRWQGELHKLMTAAELVEAPEEASTSGIIRYKLQEFVRKADLSSTGEDHKDREDLLHGAPVVQAKNGVRYVYFRAADFVDFLKKTKSEELKGPNLWMALRASGIDHMRVRTAGTVVPVWAVPLSGDDEIDIDEPELEPDL